MVITGWKPHFMWAKYKLKYLKDPKGVYPKDQCVIISRRGFKKDGSEAGAKKWYDTHKELVNSWFK